MNISSSSDDTSDTPSYLFDDYLENFQEDIKKIIGKFRRPNHHLSPEELASEVNHSLLDKRDSIISNFEGEFTESNFKKIAYAFVRNVLKWSQWRIGRSPYVGKRTDIEYYTEDGVKNSFDMALETNGCGEDFYEDFDRNSKCKFLLKMVKDYCSIFTDQEVKVLSFLEKGMKHAEIADKLGVTHQNISILSISVGDKIKAHLAKDALKDTSYNDVSKGHKSISDFFTSDPNMSPMKDEDKPALKAFLLENARAYTSLGASEAFLNGKYSNRQIAAFASKNKLSFCLIRKNSGYKFSQEESEEILSLFLKGKSSKSVSKLTGIPLTSIRGKRASLVRAGHLESSLK